MEKQKKRLSGSIFNNYGIGVMLINNVKIYYINVRYTKNLELVEKAFYTSTLKLEKTNERITINMLFINKDEYIKACIKFYDASYFIKKTALDNSHQLKKTACINDIGTGMVY